MSGTDYGSAVDVYLYPRFVGSIRESGLKDIVGVQCFEIILLPPSPANPSLAE